MEDEDTKKIQKKTKLLFLGFKIVLAMLLIGFVVALGFALYYTL